MSNKKGNKKNDASEAVANLTINDGQVATTGAFQFNFSAPAAAAAAESAVELKPHEEFINHLPPVLQERVKKLQEIQKKCSTLLSERDKEIRAISAKYEALQEPFLAERRTTVATESAGGVVGIPAFWLQALRNHPELGEAITEKDEEAIKALQDITMQTLVDKNGFSLVFHFGDNAFFTNNTLTKTYEFDDDEELKNIVGCPITWKEGMNLTVKLVKKKTGKGAKAKVVKKEAPCESFFRFFSPPDITALQQQQGGEDDDEEEGMAEAELAEADFELGLTIKQIVNNPVSWFTGEAVEDLMGFGDDEDDDDEDDEDDDEDDDDDEEEEEDTKKKAKGPSHGHSHAHGACGGHGHSHGAKGGKGPAGQEECKQQ